MTNLNETKTIKERVLETIRDRTLESAEKIKQIQAQLKAQEYDSKIISNYKFVLSKILFKPITHPEILNELYAKIK